jgi:hypothetical protein
MRIPIDGLLFSLLIVAYVILVVFFVRSVRRRDMNALLMVLAALACMFFFVSLGQRVAIEFQASPETAVVSHALIGTPVILLLGALLFFIKVRSLRWYAVLELVFAIVVAAQTIAGFDEQISPTQLLGFMAGAYLVIRGLDNFKKDWDARKASASHTLDQLPQTSTRP